MAAPHQIKRRDSTPSAVQFAAPRQVPYDRIRERTAIKHVPGPASSLSSPCSYHTCVLTSPSPCCRLGSGTVKRSITSSMCFHPTREDFTVSMPRHCGQPTNPPWSIGPYSSQKGAKMTRMPINPLGATKGLDSSGGQ